VLQKVGRAVLFSNAGHAKSPKSSALTTVDLEKSQLVSNLFNRLPCQHMQFRAVDFVAQGNSTPLDWANTLRSMRAEGLFLGGIRTYSTFVHVDTRGYNADW
jgi:hypothetical protein